MRVDAGVDKTLQDELGELVLQCGHCGVEGHGHFVHVGRDVRAEVLQRKEGVYNSGLRGSSQF